jgi:hypothetical protein
MPRVNDDRQGIAHGAGAHTLRESGRFPGRRVDAAASAERIG